MVWPESQAALDWMRGQGVEPATAAVLLRAAGGRPQDALRYARSGDDAQTWTKLPSAMARGDISVFREWSPAQIVDALHKLSHDLLAQKVGARPRFFASADLPEAGSLAALSAWAKALATATRTVEHPFNPGLMTEALVSQAQNALNSGP
jgi:DNA polymerase-3 subunit delta'